MASPNTNRKAKKSSNDLYNTPIDALEAAWDAGVFEPFDTYWDPCDGLGSISDFLESRGKEVYRSDIRSYREGVEVVDFLKVRAGHYPSNWSRGRVPPGVECIVFNPPFKISEQFIDHALVLSSDLIMFNRATILETASRSAKHTSREWRLKKFWSMANRVSCSEGIERKKTSNSVWYGWFQYDQAFRGQPSMDWLFTKGQDRS